jgi:hypothetical protein
MQDLIIVGDSWGCGAWSSLQGMHRIPDDYFSKYFSKNYKVTNLSKGAKSNKNSLENLIDFLVNSDIDTIQQTKYLFIQTEPLRDVLIHRGAFSENLFEAKWLNDAHQFITVSESLLMLTYLQLQHYAKARGIVINVTGGCSDIVGLDSKYDSLNVVCDSFYKLIDNDHVNSQHSYTGISKLFKFDLDLMTKETRQYIEQIIDDVYIKSNLKFNNLSDKDNQRYFGYYADNHPSHMGIDMWIEHMLPRMK